MCHVRCTRCDSRRKLKRHPDEYKRVPPCRNCGNKRYSISHWMNRRDTAAMSCRCSGYISPTGGCAYNHRIGSKGCFYNQDGTKRDANPDGAFPEGWGDTEQGRHAENTEVGGQKGYFSGVWEGAAAFSEGW